MSQMQQIQIIDSHTGGEPTRVVISGGPRLGHGTLAERRARFGSEFDHYRSAICNEPRGSDPVVGALLCEPRDPSCVAGVIFFNNVGTIGMCGHGTIGLVVTLAHLGRIGEGTHRIETPVGVVEATLQRGNRVSLRNVASYRSATQVAVEVPGYGRMHGDIAWGGNWFFLVSDHGLQVQSDNIAQLTDCSVRLRAVLDQAGIRGDDGSEIDHIELFGPSSVADSRSFVLCPGLAYDRSPCGTGTSAKLACLAADGKLAAGQIWWQESIIGSVFEAQYEQADGQLYPRITGTAYVNGATTLMIDPQDPFAWGIRSEAMA
ncbi:4-hydroxyproline epimerase [Chitinimonas viridis]|uniref:4-hydroxyproline epimerase n=1 Tax=Chitinimonas viridis TaxID=664880 RepID=UPI0027E5A6F5|nr:4-hydroxyproline epimerase [Chitinimonas viridis]